MRNIGENITEELSYVISSMFLVLCNITLIYNLLPFGCLITFQKGKKKENSAKGSHSLNIFWDLLSGEK